ncbi:TPA: Dot/Icm type IV secretion system effector LegC3/PpeA [Legionella pneumophila]|uniref:Dot/Icm type IV secretion system effector LegC3/PpeA n=1 Tax=Legionella pneumophila TaxID=446 RepID=UPI0009783802|nr:Dot/Icm type IV secretion system effector LegC3/PpeA [Legionella pneumophila]MCZ4680976.1 Dot/Icm type IV secretion system effector LegC3/PpeA [Legionella pneumophila]MCZ4702366.1 Dot/Icm type IV secretion system effector LegC3/PpeA [Legionella pneumophila]MCZ4732533.1 Dot/Icm type IV secretion system effector LegC3/PpeA [Legionella pneumophila]MCZ4751957.1 Dot/Icm type IV secretion system effector LegC3/PpeA [Legionella pneumophila]MDW9050528.1 Dot/Icm type IV secretion system effector Leg
MIMFLANCNIEELVTEHIKQFLADEELSFSGLKDLILSKAPIPWIHSSVTATLLKSRDSDKTEVKKNLEQQSYKAQLAEDKIQKEQDDAEALKDKKLKEVLTRELNHIPTQISEQQTELRLLHYKLERLFESQAKVDVIQHSDSPMKKIKPSSSHSASIERLQRSINEREIKIQSLFEQEVNNKIKLNEVEKRASVRSQHHTKRVKRAQARIGYNSTGEDILSTLSGKNQSILLRSIQKQHHALEKKCSDLIQEADQINYPLFLEELQKYLNKKKHTLSSQEVDALKSVIKYIKQHLEFEHEVINTQSSLHIKKQSISSQIVKLRELQNKLKTLKNNNPNLTAANEELVSRNLELTAMKEHHADLRHRLGTPALLLFGLTFLFSIPLILTISGVIPFFIAPALLYILVSAPPTILLLSTLGVGIAAIVFSFKMHSNESAIKSNLQTIETNSNQMSRNSQNLKSLETLTIPTLDMQIKKDENLRDQLMLSLQKQQRQAAQAFQKAKEVECLSYATSSLLNSGDTQSSDPSLSTHSEESDEGLNDSNDSLQALEEETVNGIA